MKRFLQFVCHARPSALLSSWLIGAGIVFASPAASSSEGGGSSQNVPALSVAAELEAEAVQWAARRAGVPSDRVGMVALDPRLQLKPCSQSLRMDAPFTNLETVRVRCEQPKWQIYVRLDFKDKQQGTSANVEAPKVLAPKRSVLVLNTSLPRGTALKEDLVSVAEIDAAIAGPQALERLVDIENMELARGLAAGAPVRSFDLRPVLLVKKGQNVMMQLGQGQGFNITARLEAQQDGRMGDQIRLKNPESGRFVSGVVVGESSVRGL